MHYFLPVIFYTGTHLWHPFPFHVSLRDSLIYCLYGLAFFEGKSGILKILLQVDMVFLPNI